MNENTFINQVAVVTGAGGRLCSVIARDLAARGCRVVLIGRRAEPLEAVERDILAAGGVCMAAPCDVTDEAALSAVAERALRELGPCRYLINGAGGNNNRAITTNVQFRPEELSESRPEGMVGMFNLDMGVFADVIRINTCGSFIPARVFGRQMAQNGGGSIINFASMNSYRPLTKVPAYAMSKAAVVNMTQWLATYLAPAGIRVNAIAPGFFINERSKLILGTPETGLTARGQSVMSHTPMGRFGNPEDLLGCVRFLLDEDASGYVSGITVPVDGGFLSHSGI